MKSFSYTVKDPLGLHARPAGLLVKEAQRFASDSNLTVSGSGKSASLKRLLAVMGLGVKGGATVTVTVNGPDEVAAADAIEAWMEKNL